MERDLNEDYSISKEYLSPDFPEAYARNMAVQVVGISEEQFICDSLCRIFRPGNITGTKMLDFGCGPTVHRLVPASRQFKDITLAEYSEINRLQVEKWLKKADDRIDWSALIDPCVKAEGYSDLEAGVKEVEQRIRSAVAAVIPCDALSDTILPPDIGEFDAVFTSLCLESCCFTANAYKKAVKNLAKHVKKGGSMVMVAVLGCTFYRVHKDIACFPLTKSLIKEAVQEANFELKEWIFKAREEKTDVSDYTGFVVLSSLNV